MRLPSPIQAGCGLVAGALFAALFMVLRLANLTGLQCLVGVQPPLFIVPPLASGLEPRINLRDDPILLGNGLVQCGDKLPKVVVIRGGHATLGRGLQPLRVIGAIAVPPFVQQNRILQIAQSTWSAIRAFRVAADVAADVAGTQAPGVTAEGR